MLRLIALIPIIVCLGFARSAYAQDTSLNSAEKLNAQAARDHSIATIASSEEASRGPAMAPTAVDANLSGGFSDRDSDTLRVSSTPLSVSQGIFVDDESAPGNFVITNKVVDIGTSLTFGNGPVGKGTLKMTDGTLNIKNDLLIGTNNGIGSGSVDGGLINAENVSIGVDGRGVVKLNDSTVNTRDTISVGKLDGAGTWNQTGGITNAKILEIGSERSEGTMHIGDHASVNIQGPVIIGKGASTDRERILTISGNLDVDALQFSPGAVRNNAEVILRKRGVISTYAATAALPTDTFTFDGGTLRAKNGTDQFISGFSSGRLTLTANGGTIDANGFSVKINSKITGQGQLTVKGPGTVVLNADNGYTGATVIDKDTRLTQGTENAFSRNSNVFITSGAALDVGKSIGTIGALSGESGSVVTNSKGPSTLNIGATNHSAEFAGSIQDGHGPLSITKIGNGTQILSGTNTYNGFTLIRTGILAQGAENSFSPNSNVLIASSGILDAGGFHGKIGALAGNAGSVVTNSKGPSTLSIGTTNDSGIFAGSIQDGQGPLSITKIGDGIQILTGTNTYTGTTKIEAGVLAQGATDAFSPNSNISIAIGAALDVGKSIGTIGALSGESGSVVTNSKGPSTLNIGATNHSAEFAGSIQDGHGPLSITKIGDGIQILTGTNTYNGFTLIRTGILAQGAENSFSPNSNVLIASSGILDAGGFHGKIGALAGNAGSVVTNSKGPSTLSIGTTNDSGIFAGSIQDGQGPLSITKIGDGIQILTGTNTYTGTTKIEAGVLAQGATDAFSPNSNISIAIGAALDVGKSIGTIGALSGESGSVVTNSKGPSTLNIGATNHSAEFAGSIQDGHGPLSITKIGDGIQILTGTNTYNGFTLIRTGILAQGAENSFSPNSNVLIASSGILDAGGFHGKIGALAGNAGSVVTNSKGPSTLSIGTTNDSGIFAGSIQDGQGPLSITKIGDGIQILTGTNTYTGTTKIEAGVLAQGATDAFSPNSNISIAIGAALDVGKSIGTIGALSGEAGSVVTNSIGLAILSVGATGDSGTFAGSIQDGHGPLSITKIGDGTQILSGTNTYNGLTLIRTGILAQGAENSFSPNSNVLIASSGTLDAGGFHGKIGALLGNAGSVVTNSKGPSTLSIGATSDIGIFAGNIQDGYGPLSITKIGDGTQILTGTNTYTGNTIIQSGEFMINGQLASPNVFVHPDGVLSGIGTLSGNVVNSGYVSAGNSIGTLTINGNYAQNPGGFLLTQVSSDSSDLLRVGGSAYLGGILVVDKLSDTTREEYTILTAANGVNGTFDEVSAPADLLLGVIYDPTEVWLPVLGKGNPLKMTSLEKLAPRVVANIKDVLFNATNTQYGQLTTQFSAIRSGVSNIAGLSREPMAEQYNKRTLSHGNRKIASSKEKLCWDIWASASGIFSRMDNVNDLPKMNSITGYFNLGGNYRINQNLNVGIYAGYQGSVSRYSNACLRSNGFKYGLYGTSQWKGFYVNAIMGGGMNFFNLKNSAEFAKRRWNTQGNLFAGELDSLLGAGYEHRWNSWTFGINNSIQYTYLGISPFTQTGAENKGTNLNVRVGSQNPGSLKYSLGGNISYLWKIAPNYQVLPRLGMYWQHEFLDHGQPISSQFANSAGIPFYFNSQSAARNNAFGVVGINAQIGPWLSTFAHYMPQFGSRQFYSNAFTVGANLNF